MRKFRNLRYVAAYPPAGFTPYQSWDTALRRDVAARDQAWRLSSPLP